MKKVIDEKDFVLTVEFQVKNEHWEPIKEDCEHFIECVIYGMVAALLANGNHLIWFWQEFRQLCKKAHDRLTEFTL